MRSEYIMAVEKKMLWRRLFDSGEALRDWETTLSHETTVTPTFAEWRREMHDVARDNLRSCDTYYVNEKFCSMVDHARLEFPGNLKFDPAWLPSSNGIVFFGKPFTMPELNLEGEDGETLEETEAPWITSMMFGCTDDDERIFIQVFIEKRGDKIPFPIDYYMIHPGSTFTDCLAEIVDRDGEDLFLDPASVKHPIRMVFALLYLMAQKLAMALREPVSDRALRRRAEKTGQEVPDDIKIITLRRLEAARKADPASVSVDWKWQWEVRGHWRNQFHPSTGEHEQIFIEAYVKGPEDKPLKHCSNRLFLAAR